MKGRRNADEDSVWLCNHTVGAMSEWLRVCEEKGYVKPTVYQGQYNAICRHDEKTLYPLLRTQGIRINI
jgi:aflatoxin B1 aldehyde reductase